MCVSTSRPARSTVSASCQAIRSSLRNFAPRFTERPLDVFGLNERTTSRPTWRPGSVRTGAFCLMVYRLRISASGETHSGHLAALTRNFPLRARRIMTLHGAHARLDARSSTITTSVYSTLTSIGTSTPTAGAKSALRSLPFISRESIRISSTSR